MAAQVVQEVGHLLAGQDGGWVGGQRPRGEGEEVGDPRRPDEAVEVGVADEEVGDARLAGEAEAGVELGPPQVEVGDHRLLPR